MFFYISLKYLFIYQLLSALFFLKKNSSFLTSSHSSLPWARDSFSFISCPTFRMMYLWALYLGWLEFLSVPFSTSQRRPPFSVPGSSWSHATCLVFLFLLHHSLYSQGLQRLKVPEGALILLLGVLPLEGLKCYHSTDFYFLYQGLLASKTPFD